MSTKVASAHRNRRPEFRKIFLYQGLMARVARQLNLSRSHVFYVATGKRQSGRVSAALIAELNRIEKIAA